MSFQYRNHLGMPSQVARAAWNVVYVLLFRPSPVFLHAWRRFLLRRFRATVAGSARPYPKCRVWAPWNLWMGPHSCLANDVECYSVAKIRIEEDAVVSQYAFLCTATHDYCDPEFALLSAPITIGPRAWVAAGAFIGPGVEVGAGAVVAARAVAVKDVAPWTVVAGNPAKVVKARVLQPA